MKLNILYEDNHLIVVEKEANVLTQGATLDLPVLLDQVKSYIKEKYSKTGNVFLGLIHRLDTNVAGVVCFAKTSKAASRLSEEIRKHRFEKKYLTIVEGKITSSENITLKDFLAKDEENKKAIITTSDLGKESILTFKKLAQIDNNTLVEVDLLTGRFHQIRAQLSNYGTPIIGDRKYGGKFNNIKSATSKNSHSIALYAYSLSFNHPITKEKLTINNLPKDKVYTPFLKIAKL